MVYRRDQPVAGNSLRRSQPLLKENTNSADDSFGEDHYAFSNLTTNNGFHQKVTGPVQSAHVSTGADTVTLYTMQDYSTIGPLQYSRGQNDAVPTPLTSLHSGTEIKLAPSGTSDIFDFSGSPPSYGLILIPSKLSAAATPSMYQQAFSWNGSILVLDSTSGPIVRAQVSSNILQVKNTSTTSAATEIYWTLHFDRIIP